jgi:hypothetical protein
VAIPAATGSLANGLVLRDAGASRLGYRGGRMVPDAAAGYPLPPATGLPRNRHEESAGRISGCGRPNIGAAAFRVSCRSAPATDDVRVVDPAGAGRGVRPVSADGQPAAGGGGPLPDDGRAHPARGVLG